MTEIKIIYSLYSDNEFHPNYITETLKVFPSRSWLKGDPLPSNKLHFRKETCWELSTQYSETLDLENELKRLLDTLIPKEELIRDLVLRLKLESQFDIVIRIEENQTPAVVLSKEMVASFERLNAAVHFDLYMI